MKTLVLYDGCEMRVNTEANTTAEFLETVPTKTDWQGDKYFKYDGEWFIAWDLELI